MSVEFIGYISNNNSSETIVRSGPVLDRHHIETVAKAHENAGFDRVLLAFHSTTPDGLQVGQHVLGVTDRLKVLIAQRPGFTAPTLLARQLATVDQFSANPQRVQDGLPPILRGDTQTLINNPAGNFNVVPPGYKTGYAQQGNFGIEQAIPKWAMVLKVAFVTNLADGATVKAAPQTLVRGLALGGAVGVKALDVSRDGGASWSPAELGRDEGKFSFRAWQTKLDLPPETSAKSRFKFLGCRAVSCAR